MSYWDRMHSKSQERVDQREVRAKAVKRLRTEGYTLREIAAAVGCSKETVRRILWDLSH